MEPVKSNICPIISLAFHRPRFLKKVEAHLLVIGDDSLGTRGSTLVFRLIGETTDLCADVRLRL